MKVLFLIMIHNEKFTFILINYVNSFLTNSLLVCIVYMVY